MKISHSFAYEESDGGAVILRCFLRDGNVEVPARLDNLPVTSLAPYAFSAHADPHVLDTKDKSLRDQPDALCGNALEKLVLPDTIRSVGRYCFYDCEKLTSLEFPAALDDWGSGAFSGCHKIRQIFVRALPDEPTGLKELLGQVKEEVLVTFRDPKNAKTTAGVFFPSFYEDGVENTPARILVDQVHGTGILYRNAFGRRKLDFAQYDALFPYALAQEDEGTLLRLVLCRLCYPYDLKKDEDYRSYVQTHLYQAGSFFMDLGDTKHFSWLLSSFEAGDEEEVLSRLSRKAALENRAQMQSILMAFMQEHPSSGGPKKRLEL